MSTLQLTKQRTGRRALYVVAEHAPAIAVALCFLLPLTVCVLTAFMTQHQAGTGSLWPSPWQFGNFGEVFKAMPFGRDLLNTMLYAGLSTIGVVVSSVPVAYALARLRWRGREAVFLVVLAAMMIPAQVTSLPLYVMYAHAGWVGTLKPLIVPSFFGDAFSIFLLRQFFLTIPDEFTEAARVDGAGELRIPVAGAHPDGPPGHRGSRPVRLPLRVERLLQPAALHGQQRHRTDLAVALSQLAKNGHQNAYQLQMAASLLFLLPVLVLFFLAQKVFVEGIALTGVKG